MIVASGLMLVVVTAEIDISVGSLTGLLAAMMGLLVSKHHAHLPLWIGLPATLLAGTLIGMFTGLLVTVGRVPSIIATLGLLTMLRGCTTLVMGGHNIDGLPDSLANMTKVGIFGVPIGIWTAGAVVGCTWFLIHHMPLGRRLFALGSSDYSAKMIGLPRRRLKVFVFAYTGFLTALATIVDVPRLPKIEAGIGVGFELLVVTCVVVGGVSISGGRGRLSGVLLAVVLMTMIRPVLTFLDIGEAGEKWTKAIQGAFIIVAVISDSFLSRRSGEGNR
jgi:ribose/xylose/arabinose/galactoside ABC-type transport system permease subunit